MLHMWHWLVFHLNGNFVGFIEVLLRDSVIHFQENDLLSFRSQYFIHISH